MPHNIDEHIHVLEVDLSVESTARKIGDNDLKKLISDEEVNRAESDAENRIKLAEETVVRAEGDSSLSIKLSKEIADRKKETDLLETRISMLENMVANMSNNNTSNDKKSDEKPMANEKPMADEKLMISQEMYERQLNMLKRSAKFILDNLNKALKAENTGAETENKLREFFRHLYNLQLTFDNLLNNKDKYTLTDETNKCISEIEVLKVELEKLEVEYDTESLFGDRYKSNMGC